MRAAIAVGVLAALAGSARADGDDEAFARGKKLLKAGKTKEACDAFADSEHAAPTTATALALGDCNAQLGKLGTAWHFYTLAGDTAKATKVAARAGKLSLSVKPADAKVRVFANGVDASAALADAMPVDTGEVVLAASAPGFAVWRKTITIAEGDDKTVPIKLARSTEVAKLDPNDPDEPDAVVAHDDKDQGDRVAAPPPKANRLIIAGETAFEFATKNNHYVARFGYAYKSYVELSALAGMRVANGLINDIKLMAATVQGGGGVDARGYLPIGGFCRPFVHASASGWSGSGFVAGLGAGGMCQDGPGGVQLMVGFDQEVGGDHSRGVVVGVGHAIAAF